MRVKDRMRIAVQNLKAGRQMVGKIIFGMTFVLVLLLCSLMSIQSFIVYTSEFNDKHGADCYYYELIEDREISDTWIVSLTEHSRKEKERYHAGEVSVLCTIRPRWGEEQLEAGQIGLALEDNIYQIGEYSIFNRKPYQNIYGKMAPIEIALFQVGISEFAEKLTEQYRGAYLLGSYPEKPGEIMLDTHIMEVYGIEAKEELLGKKVSIYVLDADEVLLKDYILTGILQADFLSVRESLTADDYHLEHIYANPCKEDRERFIVSRGSIRYYFENFEEYVKNCEKRDYILRLDISQVYSADNRGIKLTEKGIEYCLLYWIIRSVGKLISLIAVGVGIIITFSIFYLVEFYRSRNTRYFAMLEAIGMEKRDRIKIFSVEMCLIMSMATILSVYLSFLFLTLMNFFTMQALEFHMVLDLKTGLLAIMAGWAYFWICLRLVMGKGRLSRDALPNFKSPVC